MVQYLTTPSFPIGVPIVPYLSRPHQPHMFILDLSRKSNLVFGGKVRGVKFERNFE